MTLREHAVALLGTWSRPPDLSAKIALGLAALFALAVVFGRGRTLLFGFEHGDADDQRRERRRFVAALALAAGLLSIAYVARYLQGGPRIVDATTYFLQGRTLAHGDLSWTPLDPSASFRGRFLLYRDSALDGPSLGGIFPPGYPLVLAFGFMLGAPMIVGPLLAVGIVVATYQLSRALAEEAVPALAEPVARSAALLSVFCAALRYHTADTMSHGASALGVTVALACAIRARQARLRALGEEASTAHEHRSPFERGRLEALLAGLATGYVIATRPISALPIALVVGWLLRPVAGPTGRSRLLFLALLGLVPGVFLLLLSQRAVTGSWLESTQRMYYANSDGPPGCFRWGFGKGIGCIFEHGDFVDARLKDGYGIVAAAGTTLRRLHKHLLDVANFEPLALLVLVPALLRRRQGAILSATALVGLQILAYVPFYFDGDYPGGGARFFADILPVEHALVVVGIALVASKSTVATATDQAGVGARFTRGVMLVLALATAGFAIHASHEHVALRDRDGGRPMFEPDVVAHAGVKNGLVFVDTDHGFALGHDPAARPTDRVVVARLRSDDHDRMLYEALGRPLSYLYKLEPPVAPAKQSTPVLTPWAPPESGAQRRFEAEAEWPPLFQENGSALPAWANECASGKRALVLTPEPGRKATATITVPVPSVGRWAVEVHTAGARVPFTRPPSEPNAEGALVMGRSRWSWQPKDTCTVLPMKEIELRPPHELVTIEASGAPIAIDYISLRKVR
ncbi:MAG TPA: hypothetical protein VM925_34470 [Labilithrix sp.]|nr:hypothetical protein [Labilithrix sp.]